MQTCDDLTRDLRYAVRQLRRSPGLTAVALLALALGIGATTTVFTVVNAILVRPLPFHRAEQLNRVAKTSSGDVEQWLSVPELARWQAEAPRGAILAGYTPMDFNLRGANPEGLTVAWASRSFLAVLGIAPRLGRAFADEDFTPGAARVALISHALWQRRYGGDPGIVGSTVDLEGPPFLTESNGRYTIVGVLPAQFWLFYSRTDFVVPMRASAKQMNDASRQLVATVLVRLSGTGREPLRSALTAASRRLEHESSRSPSEPATIEVTSLRDWHFGDLHQPLLFLMGAALVVALTACANVALVLVARTSWRHRELAIRVAIGAGRGRVIRQLLTESLLLAIVGGVLGACLAAGAVEGLSLLIPHAVVSRLPEGLEALSLDLPVALVAVAGSVFTGLLSGLGSLAAARMTGRFDAVASGASRAPARRPLLQDLLVIAQTIAAVVLLIAGGLLVRSLVRLNDIDLGVVPRSGLVVWLNMNLSRYSGDDDRVQFYEAVFERLRAEPEVAHASGVDMPFNVDWQTTRFALSDGASQELNRWPQALARAATPTYFERHGIRLIEGRTFTERDDRSAAPVAVVSETLARRYWPGRSPIGEQVVTRSDSRKPVSSTVVGVVGDVRSTPTAAPRPIVYRPVPQAPPPWMYITIEATAGPNALLPAIRRAVWAVDPDQPLDGPSGPWTLDEWLTERLQQPRLLAAIGNALSGIAVSLALVGLYGLLSYTVTRRTSEFGLRMALGATPAQIMRLVLRDTLSLAVIGVALGLVAAAFVARLLSGMLFGVAPLDPVTFAAAALVFLAVAVLASLLPARRALSVSAAVALRAD